MHDSFIYISRVWSQVGVSCKFILSRKQSLKFSFRVYFLFIRFRLASLCINMSNVMLNKHPNGHLNIPWNMLLRGQNVNTTFFLAPRKMINCWGQKIVFS